MSKLCFTIDRAHADPLQLQIRSYIVNAILQGQLRTGTRLPSTRSLAKQLGVSRNTVVQAYQELVVQGYLDTNQRSAYCVSAQPLARPESINLPAQEARIKWDERFCLHPDTLPNIVKPSDWIQYRYPFIYGQPDPQLFPVNAWRLCSARAISRGTLANWTGDNIHNDDPELIDLVKTQLLLQRGILARDDQILMTLGAQNALYMAVQLLCRSGAVLCVEEPGYPDIRNMAILAGAKVKPVDVKLDDAAWGDALKDSTLIYVTPGHHLPTTRTMPIARRKHLIEIAARYDCLIIEDDYECETDFSEQANPALKAMDTEGRVIYVGSLSKSLFPGLRIGYVVADTALIAQMRALRRLIARHVPLPIQRTVAQFIALGYHQALVRSLRRTYQQRWRKITTLADILL
ncbi:MAG: PLP-dependent aminotransferase family protein, partial [Pseudomonadota bacterium]